MLCLYVCGYVGFTRQVHSEQDGATPLLPHPSGDAGLLLASPSEPDSRGRDADLADSGPRDVREADTLYTILSIYQLAQQHGMSPACPPSMFHDRSIRVAAVAVAVAVVMGCAQILVCVGAILQRRHQPIKLYRQRPPHRRRPDRALRARPDPAPGGRRDVRAARAVGGDAEDLAATAADRREWDRVGLALRELPDQQQVA
eukprot:COSAG05_NODE_2795_length_2629_cov_3.130435_1_plen_201_part_00